MHTYIFSQNNHLDLCWFRIFLQNRLHRVSQILFVSGIFTYVLTLLVIIESGQNIPFQNQPPATRQSTIVSGNLSKGTLYGLFWYVSSLSCTISARSRHAKKHLLYPSDNVFVFGLGLLLKSINGFCIVWQFCHIFITRAQFFSKGEFCSLTEDSNFVNEPGQHDCLHPRYSPHQLFP